MCQTVEEFGFWSDGVLVAGLINECVDDVGCFHENLRNVVPDGKGGRE